MRVTKDMRSYVRDLVAKKVEGRWTAAVEAKRRQEAALAKAMEDVSRYAASLLKPMTEKVVEYAKARGLTFLPHEYNYYGGECEGDNLAFSLSLCNHDYEETTPCKDGASPEVAKVRNEPDRIRKAVDKATNAIVFSLELGKVRKAELEELIASTEVEL